jgi:hypothetical protein
MAATKRTRKFTKRILLRLTAEQHYRLTEVWAGGPPVAEQIRQLIDTHFRIPTVGKE